ncbi:MAG: futalosine hydrolase [Deltaproteobacteria bacterium]|nr:futalosine hydrolase [Deltaproteobacteria bacterium]
MSILLVASTAAEIAPVCAGFGIELPRTCKAGYVAERGELAVLVCGVGQLQCGVSLARLLEKMRVDAVVSAGIAGSFTADLRPPRTVLVKEEVLADLGAETDEGWLDLFQIGLADPDQEPFSSGMLMADAALLSSPAVAGLPAVRSITVNTVLSRPDSIERARVKYNPQIVNMEGGAVFYVCLSKKLPFIEIRSISDMVGARDKTKWQVEEAISALNAVLANLLDSLVHGRT